MMSSDPAAYPVLAVNRKNGDCVLFTRLVGCFRGVPLADGICLSAAVPFKVRGWYLSNFEPGYG